MLGLSEIIELKQELEKGSISLEKAKDIFWKDREKQKKSWHTKDWQERRKMVLKEICEICGSEESLTVQHLSHPKKYHEYEKIIIRKHAESHINENNVFDEEGFRDHVLNNFDYKAAPLCPNCFNRKPNLRMRKTPKYLCTSCHFEFDETVSRSAEELIGLFLNGVESADTRDKCFISKNKWENRQNLSGIRYFFQREIAKNENAQRIDLEAFLLYLNDQIKYLSFEDTITACKKCAFNFDINKMDLCPSCKQNYKGIQYSTCIHCLPENRRKDVFQKIEFSKKMYEIHKNLDID
jgi:hypothetical protein